MIDYNTFEITHGMSYLTACKFLEDYMSRLCFTHGWGNLSIRYAKAGTVKGKNNAYINSNQYASNFFSRFLHNIDKYIPYSMYVDIDNYNTANHVYPAYTESTAYAKLGETKIPITTFGNLYNILTQRLRVMRLLKYRSVKIDFNSSIPDWLQIIYNSIIRKYRNDSYRIESNPTNYNTFYAEEWSRLIGWLNANTYRDGDTAQIAAPGGGFLAHFSIYQSPTTNPVFCSTVGHLVNHYLDFSWHIGDVYTTEVWSTGRYKNKYASTLLPTGVEYKTNVISGEAKNNYTVFPEGEPLGMTQGFLDEAVASPIKQTRLSENILQISPTYYIDAQTNFDTLMPDFYS